MKFEIMFWMPGDLDFIPISQSSFHRINEGKCFEYTHYAPNWPGIPGFKATFNTTFTGRSDPSHSWVSPFHFGLNQARSS